MVTLFIGKPTGLLEVESETTRNSMSPRFFMLLWLMDSEWGIAVQTEHLLASSQTFGSNSGSMTFKPCVEMATSLDGGSISEFKSRIPSNSCQTRSVCVKERLTFR